MPVLWSTTQQGQSCGVQGVPRFPLLRRDSPAGLAISLGRSGRTSLLGTATSRRSKSLNLVYSSESFGGGSPCFLPMARSLSHHRQQLAGEPLVGEASADHAAEHLHESVAVVAVPLVVAERLLVHVPEQMPGL